MVSTASLRAVLSPRSVARSAASLAALAGTLGALSLMGAFGPVSCWTARSQTNDGPVTVTRGCESGVDYLLGSTTGNAPVLFFWALVLVGVVALGTAATWTDRRRLAWVGVVVGAVVSVLGAFSIGWYFAAPTLLLFVAALTLSVEARRGDGDGDGRAGDVTA